MATADLAAVARRYFEEVVGRGELAVADELFAPDFVGHGLTYAPGRAPAPPGGAPPGGPEAVKRFVAGLRRAFPDLRYSVEDTIAQGDKLMVRSVLRGTHRGDFRGVAPTGREVAVAAIAVFRFAGGRIREAWQLTDVHGLLQQLGAGPPVGPTSG